MGRDPKDISGMKIARSILGKRGIDVARADLRVMHGVLYIRGQVGIIRGFDIVDLRAELENQARILKQKPDIKDVVIDVTHRM